MTIETTIIAALALLLGWSVQRAQSWKRKAIDYKAERNAAKADADRSEMIVATLDRIGHVLDAIAIQPAPAPAPTTKPRAISRKASSKPAAKKAAPKKAAKKAAPPRTPAKKGRR